MSGNLALVVDYDVGLAIIRFGPQVVNAPPVAFDQAVATTRDTPVEITLTASDVDTGDALSYVVTSLPSNGALSEGATSITTVPHPLSGNTVTYTPYTGFIGNDDFSFVANDSEADSDPATVAVRVAKPVELELVGRWPYGLAYAVAEGLVNGAPHAFLGSGGVVLVLDVTDPSAPSAVGELITPGDVWGLTLTGNFLLVADWDSGLRIIDISDPSAPVEVGFLDTPGRAYNVVVSGDLALVAAYSEGLRVIDISEPSAPVEVGFLDTPGRAFGVGGVWRPGPGGRLGFRVEDNRHLGPISAGGGGLPGHTGPCPRCGSFWRHGAGNRLGRRVEGNRHL